MSDLSAAMPPKPERQIIHELCLLLHMFHMHGSEASACKDMPEWLARRYQWALQQAEDA